MRTLLSSWKRKIELFFFFLGGSDHSHLHPSLPEVIILRFAPGNMVKYKNKYSSYIYNPCDILKPILQYHMFRQDLCLGILCSSINIFFPLCSRPIRETGPSGKETYFGRRCDFQVPVASQPLLIY